MSGSERVDARGGPFGNLWQTYAEQLDALAKGCEPAALGFGRCNLELMTLAVRRTQAWLEQPARLGGCRTPQDLMSEQVRFWQTAGSHYAESGQRWWAALMSTALNPMAKPDGDGRQPREARDYIAVAEVKATPAARPSKDRRAA